VPEIRWERFPNARSSPAARDWLLCEADAGLSATTVAAYSRAVEGYLAYCRERRIAPRAATTEQVADYLGQLASVGLRGATLRQRLAAIRLFYAYVVERGERADNPAVGLAGGAGRPLLGVAPASGGPTPWTPGEDEWLAVLVAAGDERPRTRVMLALAYDAALRREELCGLRAADLDRDGGTLRTRAAGRPGRVVPLSPAVAERCAAYLRERAAGDDAGEALFASESPRNRDRPIAIWTWSKVVRALARRAGVESFTTHTPRHLRLTDLARAGWGAGEIARFAGLGAGAARRYIRLAEAKPTADGQAVARRRIERLVATLFGGRP
jgi:site-specific recombinase XerD